MSNNYSLPGLTRKALYNLVWSKPATKLAEKFGVSDVAVAKRCRVLNIPRPPRGYWAKVAARYKLEKPPLPPPPEAVFAKAARQAVAEVVSMPENTDTLHPTAAALMRSISTTKSGDDKRLRICEQELPKTIVTSGMAERVSKAFHVILKGTESLGIIFRKSRSSYDPGYFQKGNDRLYIKIEEELVETDQNYASWQRPTNGIPCGHLTFILNAERYGDDQGKRWVEGRRSLEKLLAQIVKHIRQHYVRVQRRRAKEAIERAKERVESEKRHQEWLKMEAIREREEQKRKHSEALEAMIRRREKNLLKAAEWWRLHEVTQEFILACEKRWRGELMEQLLPEQEEWLTWARETSSALSPFGVGYPQPVIDGPFDPEITHSRDPWVFSGE